MVVIRTIFKTTPPRERPWSSNEGITARGSGSTHDVNPICPFSCGGSILGSSISLEGGGVPLTGVAVLDSDRKDGIAPRSIVLLATSLSK